MRLGEPAKIWKSSSKFYYLSKADVSYFCVFNILIWLLDILISVRFRKFSFNKISFDVKKIVAILNSPDKFLWSSSLQGQQMYQIFVKILQGVLIKNEKTNFILRWYPGLHVNRAMNRSHKRIRRVVSRNNYPQNTWLHNTFHFKPNKIRSDTGFDNWNHRRLQ